MANTPKKVAVIGLDCALTHLIEKHIADGHLPTFKKLFESGAVAENCLPPYPTITPPNWATIASGAWPGTHGITDFHVHIPGTTPDSMHCVQALNSERCNAEFLWDVADRAGKKCIVLNYPGSWPSHMKNGIMVGGGGLSIGAHRDGLISLKLKATFCSDMIVTTGFYPQCIRGTFKPASDWRNLSGKEDEVLELEAFINFRDALVKPDKTSWYVLAQQSEGDGYDTITLSPDRNFKNAFCTLKVGQWSPKITARIRMKDGAEEEAFFRCKLIELSDDCENFRLYISAMGAVKGWSAPPEIADELQSEQGIVGHAGGIIGYVYEWYDLDTFTEINEFYTQWLTDATATLLSKHEWDLFFMHAHSPDWAYHVILTEMDLNLTKDEVKRQTAWEAHLKIYEAQDRMLAKIIETCGDDTLVILVSDHGAVPDGYKFDPYAILTEAGLSVIKSTELTKYIPTTVRGEGLMDEFRPNMVEPDPHKSKCFPQRTIYVYINLKGRDPEGIVEPGDYPKVQQQIIDALLTYIDPKTGMRPISLALGKQDARILGLYGDGVGDVVYALYPWYGGQHGNILPASEWGVGSLKSLLTFTGPGIKKGYRLHRNCGLVDVVPTICYLMNLPLPRQAEGAVIYQVFEDPNFKSKQISWLRDNLAQMEKTLLSAEHQK